MLLLLLLYCQSYDRLLVTTWGHDPAIISTSNILLTLNDALSHSAILVQVSTVSRTGIYRVHITLLLHRVGITLHLHRVGITLHLHRVGITLHLHRVGITLLLHRVGITLHLHLVGITLHLHLVGVTLHLHLVGVTLLLHLVGITLHLHRVGITLHLLVSVVQLLTGVIAMSTNGTGNISMTVCSLVCSTEPQVEK